MADIGVLREHLTEDTFNQVTEELKDKGIKLADLSKGDYVSKSKYDTAVTEAATNKTTAEKWEGDYNNLKGEYETFKTTAGKEKAAGEKNLIKAMIQTELVKAKARDIEVVMPLIDTEKVTRTDTGLEGLKEQLDTLTSSKGYLFETEEPGNPGKGKGGLDHNPGGTEGDDAEIKKIMGLPV